MHTLSKRLQHEEEKDDVLMGGGKGGLKKKKVGEGLAQVVPNPRSRWGHPAPRLSDAE